MATLQQLIQDALVASSELGRGQTASPEDLANGLAVLNLLLDSWSTERLSIYSVQNAQFTLVPNQQDYTIGPSGATYTYPRPVFIQTARLVFGT